MSGFAIFLAGALAGLVAGATAVWWRRLSAGRRLREAIGGTARALDSGMPLPRVEGDGELDRLAAGLARSAERCLERIRALESDRNHLREILAGMSEGLLETDAAGRVRLVNPAFRKLFGVERDVAGRTAPELTRRPEIAGLVERTLQGEVQRELEIALEGGRVAALSGVPLPEGGALIVARNVTDRVRLDATRRDFVANISHEIKTPLTAIRGFAETLREGALDDPAVARKFVERILWQCRRLEALLADLLALSRLESAAVTADENRQEVDLEQLARHALETVAGAAKEREVSLQLEVAGPWPRMSGHPEALERMLLNLLENAIKYNRRGGWVRLRLAAVGPGLTIEVRDSGIGIPADALPRVFERFYRVDKGRARDEGGTGLGLALVKHAAALHGGKVEVESDVGAGSCFRVSFPTDAR